MNKLLKVFAMTLLLVLGGQAMAQSRGAMFLSATFPMKDYAKYDGPFYGNFALTTPNVSDAGAGMGFNAGLKWYYNVGVNGLGVLLSVDGFYNGPTKELKNAYRNQEGEAGGQFIGGSFKYNATPKYVNIPAMVGLNYIFHFNSNLGIYIEAGAGGNLRLITDMETVTKGTLFGVETQVTETQDYEKAFSFAYQAGIGFEVAKNLVIGCSFYDLGSATVNSEHTLKTKTLNDNVTTKDVDYPSFGTVHPIMVLGRIGFSF